MKDNEKRYEVLNDGLIYDKYNRKYLIAPSKSTKEQYKIICGIINKKDKKIKQLKQSQNKLAISELEMLQRIYWKTIKTGILRSYVCSIINGQIEQLKEEG